MNRLFPEFIKPLLLIAKPSIVIEVGAHAGDNTEKLMAWCFENNSILHMIDPSPKFDFAAMERKYSAQFRAHIDTSLNALKNIVCADMVLIDGDHNWYTVINELRILTEKAQAAAIALPIILLHDVAEPCAYRDHYYAPARIPEQYRHKHHPGGEPIPAIDKDTPRNGVLCAVKDFMAEYPTTYQFKMTHKENGLGALISDHRLQSIDGLAGWFNGFGRC